jgi:hypothetical protein
MNQLGAILYDPAAAVSKATSSLLAMTAFDTTNLRLTVTVPAHGRVLFKIRCMLTGATTTPTVLLGVLNGATVVGRVTPQYENATANAATQSFEMIAEFTATGLTPGSTAFDAAYAVQVVVASTNIKYGGPNTNAGANAWGAFSFEAWDPTPMQTNAQLVIDANGRVDVSKITGTTQTARDLGASVLLSPGTGTGQIDLTSGIPKANVTQLLGTAWLTPAVAGTPDVNAKQLGGTAQTGRDVGASVIAASVTAGVTVTTNNDKTGYTASTVSDKTGYSLTQTFPTNFSSLVIDGTGRVNAFLIGILTSVFTETSLGLIAAAFKQFFNISSPTSTMNAITAVTTVTNLTNAPTAGDLTATMKTSVTTAATAATPSVTVSDKTGFSLSTAGILAIWHQLTSAVVTAATMGKLIVDYLDAAVSSRSTYAGADTSGTTTLLSRLTGTRATNLDNLDATVSSRSTLTAANVWDYLVASATTVGSMGKRVVDYLTGDAYTRIGAAGAGLTALGDTRIANLDATVSSRSTFAGGAVASVTAGVTVSDKTGFALTSAYDPAKTASQAGDAMALTTSERTSMATAVWASAARTLSSYGTLVADIATAVWGAAARTLTAFGFTVDTNANATETTIKAKTDQLTFTLANQVDSNIQAVNDTAVTGNGASGSEWGPA